MVTLYYAMTCVLHNVQWYDARACMEIIIISLKKNFTVPCRSGELRIMISYERIIFLINYAIKKTDSCCVRGQ